MKRVFGIIFYFLPLFTIGQVVLTDDTTKKLLHSNDYITAGFDEENIKDYLKDQKMKLNLNAGAFYGTGFGRGEYYGTYISPRINYRLSDRFTLETGITVVQSFGNYPGMFLSETAPVNPASFSARSLIFATGSYKLNEQLIISGTIYKSLNLSEGKNSYPVNKMNDYQGMIMGIDYKLGKNVHIQGQIEVSNNPYNRYSNPYSGFGSEFGNSFYNPFPSF